KDLLYRLRNRPNLNELTRNPLLLTMIAMVHRYRGSLPGRRVELYSEICDVLLGHWRAARHISDPLTAAQKRVALQPLAAYRMEHKKRDISTSDAVAVMLEPLKQVAVTGAAAESFLSDIQASSGLVLEREAGLWSFAHLTFQEYLAATNWVLHPPQEDWCALIKDSWYQETLRLYAAQGDATPLVQACLNDNTILPLILAADGMCQAV